MRRFAPPGSKRSIAFTAAAPSESNGEIRNKSRPAQLLWRIALPAYWVLCFGMTHYPRLTIPVGPERSDKWLHGCGYALLALLFWRNFAAMGGIFSIRFIGIAVSVLLGYAALDEYTQQFVQRSSDFYDWCADSAGVLAMLAALAILHGLRRAVGQSRKIANLPAKPGR